MRRRAAREQCRYSGKPKDAYRDLDAARWGAQRSYHRGPARMPDLRAYECDGCGLWHLTSRGAGIPMERPDDVGVQYQAALARRKAESKARARAARRLAHEQ